MRLRFLIFTLGLLSSAIAGAQIDPSSALLLNSGNANSGGSAIDSGRYTTRPRDPNRKEEPRPVAGRRTNRDEDIDEDASPLNPVTITVPESPYREPLPSSREADAADAQAAAPRVIRPPRNLELSRRYNLIELSFAPGYLYSDSSSEYFYRRYSMAAPMLSVEANVWLSQRFGLNGSYASTLSGHVNDSLSGQKNVPATHEWFTAGMRFREFFGHESAADSISIGLDYYDYRFRVPSDASYREKLSSVGVRVSLEGELAVSPHRSWLLGVSFVPKLRQLEEATNTDAKSGGSVDANALSLSVGGRIQLDRKSGLFWKLSHSVEKDLYSGEASLADPQTAVKPSGVSVINSITLFLFGYTWGN